MARARAGLLLFVLLLAVLLVVASRLDLHAIRTALAEASWNWIAAGALVNLLSIVVDAVRWKAIIGGFRRVSVVSAVEGLLLGWLSNLILPLKLGDTTKVWVLARREGVPIATVASTVLLDRAIDASTFLLFIVLASIVAPLPWSVQKVRAWGLAGLAAIVLGFVFGRRWIRTRLRSASFVNGTLGRILDGLAILGQQHRLRRTVVVGLVAWFTRMGVVWCAMRAFHLMLPAAAAASVLAAINIGITAVAAPGNLGVFELSAIGGLALWRVPGETALSFGIALHALELVPTVMLGLVVQAVTRARVRRSAP